MSANNKILNNKERNFLSKMLGEYKNAHDCLSQNQKSIEDMEKMESDKKDFSNYILVFYDLQKDCQKNIFNIELIRKKERRFLKYLEVKYGRGLLDVHSWEYKLMSCH